MRRSTWTASLGVVAALFLAAATALGLQLAGGGGAPARAAPGACHDNLPTAWQRALGAAVVALPQTAEPLAVGPDGTLYLRAADGTILSLDGQRNVRTVYQPPATVETQTVRAYPVGAKLVVVTLDARADRVVRMDVVVSATGAATPIAVNGVSDGAALQDGKLYWDERPDASTKDGVVREYDVATGTTKTVGVGAVTAPVATVAGISWGAGSIPAPLLEPIRTALAANTGADTGAVTNGTDYAWSKGGTLYWAGADGTVRGPLRQHAAATALVRAVAGAFVFFTPYDTGDEIFVMDTRNGKVADTGLPFLGLMLGGGSVVAMGGALNATAGTPPLMQIVTSNLPPLGC